jgi:hypothetical protein
LKLKDLTMKGACLAIYPLHDHLALTLLQQKWLRLCALPHRQPEAQIKVCGVATTKLRLLPRRRISF